MSDTKPQNCENTDGESRQVEQIVIRRCSTCKWAGEEYKLDGKKIGVKHRLFVQCLIMLSEEIRKILPDSYGRNIDRYVGWEDETGKHYNTTGSYCQTWETQ